MFGAVDQPALVTETESKNFRRLQLRPDRLGKPSSRRGEDLVNFIFLIGVKPDPLLDAFEQAELLRAGVLVVGVAMDRDDPHATTWCHRQVKVVIRTGDAYAG